MDYTPNLPVFKGSAQRIEQVVINLVMNACQALADSGRAVRIRTGMASDKTGVFVEIQDEGIGVPPEIMAQIKDPFYTTKRDAGGTGLGLAISDRIVRDHDGEMTFISEPGKGTTVQVYFPVSESDTQKAGRDS